MNLINSGRIWPYSIAFAIALVFSFCVATVYITSKGHINESNLYMEGYHSVDADANNILQAEIAFNKKYTLSYINNQLSTDGSIIQYKIVDKNNHPINSAKISLMLTRPDADLDVKPINPTIKDGIYTFDNVKLPREGRWDIMAKIQVEQEYIFYTIKADTRFKKVKKI
jgi:hypothetical protein